MLLNITSLESKWEILYFLAERSENLNSSVFFTGDFAIVGSMNNDGKFNKHMVSMLVSHHALQLEITIYHKLCYKSSPPPPSYIHIIIKCHLSSNFLLPSTGLVSMMKKQQQQQQKQWKTERERDGGRCFSSLCPVVDPVPPYVKEWHTG